jgi:mRNA guanylyltransferase
MGRMADRFPGSQPVSFEKLHLDWLEKEDYLVCEKSDGIRYLMYMKVTDKGPEVFLVRKRIPNKKTYMNDNNMFYMMGIIR